MFTAAASDGSIPFATTVVGIITACGTVLLALTAFIAAVKGIIPLLRSAREVQQKIGVVENQVKEVHVIVNQEKTNRENYQRALITALNRAGVDVPADQSLPEVPAEPGR
jgi:hypothetical protein